MGIFDKTGISRITCIVSHCSYVKLKYNKKIYSYVLTLVIQVTRNLRFYCIKKIPLILEPLVSKLHKQ